MLKKLTNLLLILTVASSVAAGMPLHSNEHPGTMGGDMDCCKAALMGDESPEATAARLCCVVNCSHEGTPPPSSLRVSPQSQPVVSDYQPGTPAIPASILLTRHISDSPGPPTDSHPAYIRHLALLI